MQVLKENSVNAEQDSPILVSALSVKESTIYSIATSLFDRIKQVF